jgi:hypothetical protein
MLPAIHSRERIILNDALNRNEQAVLLKLLAKVQESALAHAADPPDRGAQRRRPGRLRRRRPLSPYPDGAPIPDG